MHICQLDPVFYRAHYPDVQALTDEQLFEHFHSRGKHEGRIGTPRSLRGAPTNLLNTAGDALEIGPGLTPIISGPQVKYFDVRSEQDICAQLEAEGFTLPDPMHIHFVSPTADLSIVTGTYDVVASSHCIEHHPDLVQHLKDVERLMKPGARYVNFIPDKRYCFDHFVAETSLADVLQAHAECRKIHNLGSLIENRALATHNDAVRHWNGDHEDPDYRSSIVAKAQDAVRVFVDSNGAYVDCHAWQFTPDSFHFIVDSLADMGLSPLRVGEVYCTVRDCNEFLAVLVRA
jgi:SAM-dependent methyltransferase